MCALKYVDLTKVDKSNLEGIRNEIKHLENLKGKPNIIQLFNYELTDRRLFIVLEFGELDLQQYLSENKTMDTPTLKSYWRQVNIFAFKCFYFYIKITWLKLFSGFNK